MSRAARPSPLRTRGAVGTTGISLGGMHAWYHAAADPRVSAAAPAIGVQNFTWAVEHDAWHARAASISPLFDAAAADIGRPLDGSVVREVWRKLLPGLLDGGLDAAATLPCIAPRPLLIANSAADPRCPRAGLEQAVAAARAASGAAGWLTLHFDESVAAAPLPAEEWARGHVVTPAMRKLIEDFAAATVLRGDDEWKQPSAP